MRDAVYFCNMAPVVLFFPYTLPFHYLCNSNTLPLMMISSRSATVLSLTLFWQRWDRVVDGSRRIHWFLSSYSSQQRDKNTTQNKLQKWQTSCYRSSSDTAVLLLTLFSYPPKLPADQLILRKGCVPWKVILSILQVTDAQLYWPGYFSLLNDCCELLRYI